MQNRAGMALPDTSITTVLNLQLLTFNRLESHFMKQNADFDEGISQAYSTATLLPTPKFLTTNKSFQMMYYKRIFLKGHENCQG